MSEPASRLTTVDQARRYHAAVIEVRNHPDQGDVLLSYVVWPEVMPTLPEIDHCVRLACEQTPPEVPAG